MTLSANPTTYQVVRADLHCERKSILDVWNRNLPDPAGHEAKFAWHYLDNPCGRGACWLLKNAEGAIVGTAGLGRRVVEILGQTQVVGIASDFAVDEGHRTLAPAISLQKAVISGVCDEMPLIYGLPNSRAMGIFRRLGYEEIGVFNRHVKVLHAGRYLQSLPGLLRLAHLSSPAVNLALRAVSPETWRGFGHRVVEEMAGVDERFDDLWKRVSGRFAMIARRNAEFLDWRYVRCPLRRYGIVGLLNETRDRLLGYGVFYMEENQQAKVADLLHDGSPGAAEDVMCGLLGAARARGAASICCECLGPQADLEPMLRKFGFHNRPPEATVTARVCGGGGLAGRSEVVRKWYFFRNDEDYN